MKLQVDLMREPAPANLFPSKPEALRTIRIALFIRLIYDVLVSTTSTTSLVAR